MLICISTLLRQPSKIKLFLLVQNLFWKILTADNNGGTEPNPNFGIFVFYFKTLFWNVLCGPEVNCLKKSKWLYNFNKF